MQITLRLNLCNSIISSSENKVHHFVQPVLDHFVLSKYVMKKLRCLSINLFIFYILIIMAMLLSLIVLCIKVLSFVVVLVT